MAMAREFLQIDLPDFKSQKEKINQTVDGFALQINTLRTSTEATSDQLSELQNLVDELNSLKDRYLGANTRYSIYANEHRWALEASQPDPANEFKQRRVKDKTEHVQAWLAKGSEILGLFEKAKAAFIEKSAALKPKEEVLKNNTGAAAAEAEAKNNDAAGPAPTDASNLILEFTNELNKWFIQNESNTAGKAQPAEIDEKDLGSFLKQFEQLMTSLVGNDEAWLPNRVSRLEEENKKLIARVAQLEAALLQLTKKSETEAEADKNSGPSMKLFS